MKRTENTCEVFNGIKLKHKEINVYINTCKADRNSKELYEKTKLHRAERKTSTSLPSYTSAVVGLAPTSTQIITFIRGTKQHSADLGTSAMIKPFNNSPLMTGRLIP